MNQPHDSYPEDERALFAQLDELSVADPEFDPDNELGFLEDEQESLRIEAAVLDDLSNRDAEFAILKETVGRDVGIEDASAIALRLIRLKNTFGLHDKTSNPDTKLFAVAKLATLKQETDMIGEAPVADIKAYQTEVLADDGLTSDDKNTILSYITDTFREAALDMSNPDVAANALLEQARAEEQHRLKHDRVRRARVLVTELTHAYIADKHIALDDPLLADLISGVTGSVGVGPMGGDSIFNVHTEEPIERLRLDHDAIKAIRDAVAEQIDAEQ